MTKHFGRIALLGAAVALCTSFILAAASFDFRFKVVNKTKVKITKLLASPDGKKYGNFDIGSGIKPGETVELVWDKSTDKGNCEWYLKAVYADGSESEPDEFDFCEKDLVIEFDN